jgi:KaiC/GvpD/RAD55 family RecA-like ATPase
MQCISTKDAESLARTVASFIGAGLVADQPAVLVATSSHSAAILEQLNAMAVDPRRRMEQGELVMFDADELLNCFMVDDMPDARRFDDMMNAIVAKAGGSRKRMVRAYGEMVDLLWAKDSQAAAVSLETLWNQLIARHKCSLLCAYSSDGVGKGAGFHAICDQHSHVVPR